MSSKTHHSIIARAPSGTTEVATVDRRVTGAWGRRVGVLDDIVRVCVWVLIWRLVGGEGEMRREDSCWLMMAI
jgi:hypothetical protein